MAGWCLSRRILQGRSPAICHADFSNDTCKTATATSPPLPQRVPDTTICRVGFHYNDDEIPRRHFVLQQHLELFMEPHAMASQTRLSESLLLPNHSLPTYIRIPPQALTFCQRATLSLRNLLRNDHSKKVVAACARFVVVQRGVAPAPRRNE